MYLKLHLKQKNIRKGSFMLYMQIKFTDIMIGYVHRYMYYIYAYI